MSESIRITVCQQNSSENLEENLQDIESLVSESASQSDLVAFPENCTYIRVDAKEKFAGAMEISHLWFSLMLEVARDTNTGIVLGGVPLKEGEHLWNATVWLDPEASQPQVIYQKMHMFDVEINGHSIRESDTYSAGVEPKILTFRNWKFGLSICYDLRFSNLFEHYSREQVDAVFVPSAFLIPTGQAHWETLLKARAIEGQCYVLAPAQVGKHYSARGEASRSTYGHSLVVSPWGDVLLDLDSKENVAQTIELNREKIVSVRNKIPMHSHRRKW